MAQAAASRPAARRRRVALAVAFAALVAAGSAVAVEIGTDFLATQARVEEAPWTPPQYRPAGARVEVERGPDWSFMAWPSAGGICVAWAAGSAENWARACGRRHQAGDDGPLHLIVSLFSSSADATGRSAIVGAATPDVRRVEIALADGSTYSSRAETDAGLDVEARFFLMRVRAAILEDLFERGSRDRYPIHSYAFFDAGGRVLERYVVD